MIIRDDVPAILSKDDCELSMEDIKGLYNASTYEPPFSYKRAFDAAVSDAVHQVSKIPTQLRAAGGQALIGLGQAAKEPVRLPTQGVKVEGNAFENVIKGKKAEPVLPEKVIPEGGIIFDGANATKFGDKLVEMGMLNVKTANRNLEELNAEYEKRRPLLSKEEQESWTYSIASGGINYATMLGLSALNPVAGLGYMGALTLGGETEEGLEAYKKKHGSLEGYEGEAVTDLQINIANTGVQTLLEKVFGAPAQLQFFRSVREFARAGVLGFTDEFTTELLQNVTDAVFDKLDERLVDSEGNEISIGTVIMNGIRDNVVAGMFGGGAGIAFATYNRAKVKERIAEVIAPVVEPEKVKRVVDDVYNAGSLSIQTIVTKELENSSSLRAKRGDVYESMYNSAVKAIMNARKQGGFQDLKTEEDIAAYAKNVADNHADWVLSEANRRGVAIDEVQTGSDIAYENGRLVIGMTKGVKDLISRQESRLKDIKEVEKDLSELRGGRGAKKAEERTIVQQLRKIGITKEFADRFDIRGLMGLQDEKFGASGLFRKTGKIHDEQSLLSYLHTLGYIEDVTDTAEGEAARWDKAMKILESGAIQDMNKKQAIDDASELYSLAGVDIQSDTAEEAKAKLDDFFAKKKDEAISGEIASLTDEEQERFAMMTVEGGMTDEQALNAIKAARAEEEGLPFPTFYQESLDVANQNAELDANNPAYEGETININGVDRTVYNSNGDRIAQSEPALRNFYKWFGDSKVVDEQGRPLVVYHGGGKFDAFKYSYDGTYYFTTNKEYAERYTNDYIDERGRKGLGELKAVYLKIENPAPQDVIDRETLDQVIAQGYDGHIFDDVLSENDDKIIRVFNPNQIKSTSNRGAFNHNDDRIYYQGGEERNLVAVHSISASNLEKAINLGGFPVPSIAIVNKDQEFYFNNQPITLVGNKDLINPKNRKNEVYDRDIWSATFPQPSHKKANIKDILKFEDEYEGIFAEVNASNQLSSITGTMKRQDPTAAIDEFIDSDGAKAKYIKDVLGKQLEIPMKDRGQEVIENSFMRLKPDDQFFEDVKNVDKYPSYEENKNILAPAVDALISRMDLDSDRKADLKEVYIEEDGVPRHIADRIMYGVYKYNEVKGKLTSDIYETREYLNSQIENPEEYRVWAEKEIEDKVIGEKFIEVGKSLKPITLENIVLSMTKKQTKNSQNSLVFGTGKVIAGGAKRLNSIKEIKIASKKLVSKEVSDEKVKQLNEDLMAFGDNFAISGDMLSQSHRREAVFKALATVAGKENPTKSDLSSALNYEIGNKEQYSDDVLEAGINLINSIKNLSRYYFEVKPQRAVGLNEFSGAIIPTSTEFDAIAQKVQDNGLKVVRSDNQVEAMKQFDNVFFQKGKKAKGSIEFRGDKALIRLMDTANASTLPHELAHYYLQNTFLYNKSGLATPEYSKFYQSIADYLGIDPEQEKIEDWQHEKWARAYEAYLNGNKVADPNLKQAFDDYSKWIKRAYRLLKSKPKYRNQEGKLVEPKLTPEIIQTFSRLTNDFIARPDIESMAETVTSALQDAVVEVENKIAEDIRLAEKATMYSTTQIREAAEKGETGRSSVAYRILGEEIGYEVKKIEDQMEKARAFVRGSLQDARAVVNGNPAPEGLLNTAVNIAYTEVMQEMGNYEEADRAIRIRSLEQTRRGQEIAMERATTDDALSAEFWSNLALANKTRMLADSNFNGDVKTLQSFIKKKTEELANSIKGADKEERAKIIQEKLEEISKESGVLFQEDYESLIDAEGFEEILNETQLLIENSLGLKLDKDQIEYIQSNVKQLKDIVRDTVSTNGNISIEAFKQIRKMHNTIDSYTPSSNLAVWSSIIGRGVMLASIKSPVLNIISNIENYITESIVRSGTNLATKQTNDNLVDAILQSDYLKWDDEVYKASGYMPSVTQNILGEVPILGEKLLHSQGEGLVRWFGRFAEDTVFKYGLGYFDNRFKALTFSNVVANKATQKAYDEGLTGDQARQRANELYSDAVLLRPLTEEGAEIRKAGMIAAHETTYTQDSALSRAALKIRDVLNSGEFKAGDFLVPFVKTPANVVALGLEYSLGGLYTAYHVKDIMRDPTSEVSQKAIRAAVRNGLGVVLAMMLAALVDDDDYIPEYANASPKQRDVAKLKNAPFNSIRIGNKWISLDYFGPLAIPMAGILTARSKGSVTGFGQGVVGQALKAPGFKEVSDLIGDVTRAAQYGVSFENIAKDVASWGADQTVARTIPAFVTDLGKLIDTYERETGGEMLRRIQAKIPFLREKLPIKTDITGRKIETEPTNILFGARVKTAVDNAVVKEIDRLNKAGQAPTLSDPTRYGKFRSLETKKKDKVRAEFNTEYSKQVKRLITTGSYKRMSDSAKKNQLNKIRKKVSDELKRKHLKVSK